MEEKEKVNLNTIVKRIKSKTPGFWKKVRSYALSVGGSLVAVLLANNQFDLSLPEALMAIIKYGIAVMSAIAGTAQLTKE